MCILFIPAWKEMNVRRLKTNLVSAISVIGFIYVLSFLNSENKSEYIEVVKNKIPFLFIPLSIITVGEITSRPKLLAVVFLACCFISSLYTFYFYATDISGYALLYETGNVLPTLIHHVDFAVLLSFSALLSLHIFLNAVKWEKYIALFLFIWFVYFIHLFAVRTALVLLYISVIFYAVSFIMQKKKIKEGFGALLFLVVTAIVAYHYIPAVKTKIGYTLYGLDQFRYAKDSTNSVSDSRRFLSDKIGWQIFSEHKVTGVGIGDVQDEMNNIYKKNHPEFSKEVFSHIHNQYLFMAAGTGFIGVTLFIAALLVLFLYFIRTKNIYISLCFFSLLLVMQWEPFIENQLGASIFLITCCLGFTIKKS